MSSPFVAEIRIFPFNFAPTGWAFCAGQLLPISQNTALFSLLGTQYGGDGKSNFALPNLQGCVAVHTDQFGGGANQFPIGSASGTPTVTLLQSEMPAHNHQVSADILSVDISTTSPSNAILGNATPTQLYSNAATTNVQMSVQMVSIAGGSAPHNNMQPSLTLNYCIALQGIFPQRS
jgi:microcystin-dependent protein